MSQPVDIETAGYIARVRALPALDREHEAELARRFLGCGDRAAGERVIAANLRHVALIALRYRRLGPPIDELIAQGSLGLVAALRRFDPDRGVRFGTYASHFIRAEILALALRQRSVVGGGRGALRGKYVFRMRREHARLLAERGDEREVLAILAERFAKRQEQVAEILYRIDHMDASLDASSPGDGGRRPIVDRLPDESAADPEDTVARARRGDLRGAIAQATAELNARERYILEHRLLADEENRLSLSEIGKSFGVSRERARQIEQAVRSKLQARLSKLAVHHDLSPAA